MSNKKKVCPRRSEAGKKMSGHVPTARKARETETGHAQTVTRDRFPETETHNRLAETLNRYPETRDPTPSTQTRNPPPSTQPLHRNLSTIS